MPVPGPRQQCPPPRSAIAYFHCPDPTHLRCFLPGGERWLIGDRAEEAAFVATVCVLAKGVGSCSINAPALICGRPPVRRRSSLPAFGDEEASGGVGSIAKKRSMFEFAWVFTAATS